MVFPNWWAPWLTWHLGQWAWCPKMPFHYPCPLPWSLDHKAASTRIAKAADGKVVGSVGSRADAATVLGFHHRPLQRIKGWILCHNDISYKVRLGYNPVYMSSQVNWDQDTAEQPNIPNGFGHVHALVVCFMCCEMQRMKLIEHQ